MRKDKVEGGEPADQELKKQGAGSRGELGGAGGGELAKRDFY